MRLRHEDESARRSDRDPRESGRAQRSGRFILSLMFAVAWIAIFGSYQSDRPASARTFNGEPIHVVREAAENGDPRAQYILGRSYEAGHGVPTDLRQAVTWYAKAADQAVIDAQYVLGTILLHGEGSVQPDYAGARKWLTRAAMAGMVAAQRDLGAMYAQGLGGEKDSIWAWVWYDFAAAGGDAKAGDLRDSLSQRLNADKLDEAKRLAADIAPRVAKIAPAIPSKGP